jgi:choline-sulfatase
MGAHRMVTKQVSFYEEITRVPFMFAGPGIKQKGVKLNQPLVSLLDLLPTLCDYAELPIPGGLHGLSLLPMLEGNANKTRHDYVVSEWHTEYGYIITPGRMLRTERYKYTKYIEGDDEELYDLENDPGETHNLISNPVYSKVLKEHRELLREHLKKTNDNFFSLDFKADKRWRSHKLGYQYHEGPVASTTE